LDEAVPADGVAAGTIELKLPGRQAAEDPRCLQLRKRIHGNADQGQVAWWLQDDRLTAVVRNALPPVDG
jgi:hypothetical protein